MDKCKILLVDDNEIIRIFFKDVFWLHGLDDKFDLELSDGVVSARKIITDPQKKPDIIFLDMVMAEEKDGKKTISPETGLHFLEEIKSDEKLKDIRAFIFSSSTDKSIYERALKAGAERFLLKQDHLPQDLVKILDEIYTSEMSGNKV